jgi:radical SAM-linked protein
MRIRITFAKVGALRYTGHLDLHRLWERAARRAELPLAYSQGFHPQPKLTIAAALPLGFSSRCEVLDMRLEHEISLDGLREKLQETLPTGIQVANVERVDEKLPALQTLVASAEYQVSLTDSSSSLRVDSSELKRRVDTVLESGSIVRERRGKTYDLRPLIEMLSLETDGRIFMKLAAREGATGRPEEVLDVLGIAFESTRIERTQLIFKA